MTGNNTTASKFGSSDTPHNVFASQVSESSLGFRNIFDRKATGCRDDELWQDAIVFIHLLNVHALKAKLKNECTTWQ